MLFNSIDFGLFLPLIFLIYWLVVNQKLAYQNIFLLVASYFFYASWDWRFLFLLIFSTLLDYAAGLLMHGSSDARLRKLYFFASIALNLGLLIVFKYFNFFAQSFSDLLYCAGIPINPTTINLVLPIGISFYTFHGLSYVIDVYKGKLVPERNFVNYAVFVCFFPLLVAGPIERAAHLLPQIKMSRIFNYAKTIDGLQQILWGLFKKIVIADHCAAHVDMIFRDYQSYSGITLVMGAVLFAIQVYCDFSGYSDIAIGTSRMLGFDVLRNFAYPFFSRDIPELWRRWHISLTSWIKDYVYIPLGGSNGSVGMQIRNSLLIFLVSGLWHGAAWTFLAWGLLHWLYYLPHILFKTTRKNTEIVAAGQLLPSLRDLLAMGRTFCLFTFSLIFFRSESMPQAFEYVANMATGLFSFTSYLQLLEVLHAHVGKSIPLLIVLTFVIEWLGRTEPFALSAIANRFPKVIRWSFYYALIFAIYYFNGNEQAFIYFQF